MADTRAICVSCNSRMRPEKNGVCVKYSANGVQHGDLWECPECGYQIIMGLASEVLYYPPYNKEGIEKLQDKALADC